VARTDTLSGLVLAALLLLPAGCGVEAGGDAAALARAVDDHGAQVEEGDGASVADLIFGLVAAGLRHDLAVNDERPVCTGEDPREKGDRAAVDEPLTPRAAQDRRDLVSGTSPDPAPEIDPAASASDCEEGYTLFQGDCLPDEVVAGLLALGLDPDAPPPAH